MEESFFIVAKRRWMLEGDTHAKRVRQQNLCPLGRDVSHLQPHCKLLVKFRGKLGQLVTDTDGEIRELKGEFFVRSERLCKFLVEEVDSEYIVLFLEGTGEQARCVVQSCDPIHFEVILEEDPTLRLETFGLPPHTVSTVTNQRLVGALYKTLSPEDRELFAVHVSRFLDAPHILTPLFAHVLSLRSEDNLNFIIELKKVAEQIRGLLLEHGKSVGIREIKKSHVELWSEVQGERIAFLDGGVARIPGVARLEPLALRVGVYAVRPGERDIEQRERWYMRPYVVGDCVDPVHPILEDTDRRRLHEAARYTFEPLTGLHFLERIEESQFLFMHGPLVNQFAMYDEGQPHFIPALAPEFIAEFGINEGSVRDLVKDLPEDPVRGKGFWNHFMAVYAWVMMTVSTHRVPIAGVVERVAGKSVARSILRALQSDKVITEAYVRKVQEVLDRYDISDDFLFGCVLREGEYVTPVVVEKNLTRRARDRWQLVVSQLPSPMATMLKTEESAFPFRIEMNAAAASKYELLARLVYHTARLLPRYAFPVGLDIADKYAKVPDWISRGISAEMSASIIRRALRTGDVRTVSQVRQLLARTPRDFFFRPGTEIRRS